MRCVSCFSRSFSRGHSARGLNLQRTPKSIGSKLIGALLLYSVIGLFALALRGASIFMLAVYLHSMTFLFLGMFVASAAGEMLFNRDEADILMHRPIEPCADSSENQHAGSDRVVDGRG